MLRIVKECLKKFLPPPTNSFMREVTIIKKEINIIKDQLARQNELSAQLLSRLNEQNDHLGNLHGFLESINHQQNDRLGNLYSFLESINRENLRQYFESHSERIAIKEQYLELTQRLQELENSKTPSKK